MKKVITVILTLLLACTLAAFGAGLTGLRVVMPAMQENGSPVSDSVITGELDLARERIEALAKVYGFPAEPAAACVDRELLRDLHVQSALWWHSLLADGMTGPEINWDTEKLEQTLVTELGKRDDLTAREAEKLAYTAADEIRKSINRMVLPLRQNITTFGANEAGRRLDIGNLVQFALGTPWIMLALCALLAGLIFLTEGRWIRRSLLWIGSALGAAGLLQAALVIVYLSSGVMEMIREASKSLALQAADVQSQALWTACIVIAVMLLGCVLCLWFAGKRRDNA